MKIEKQKQLQKLEALVGLNSHTDSDSSILNDYFFLKAALIFFKIRRFQAFNDFNSTSLMKIRPPLQTLFHKQEKD